MSQLTYEASVYSRLVKYTNFHGKAQEVTLHFALDPLKLMEVIGTFQPKKSKSNNPARRNQVESISDEEQIRFVRELAITAAGVPSDDGESWEEFDDFEESLAGKAFMTKLLSSDGDRKEFAEKVILSPFRAFVEYAEADETNTPKEVAQFREMVTQLENVFKAPAPENESLEDRRARLAAELAAMDKGETVPGTVVDTSGTHPNT